MAWNVIKVGFFLLVRSSHNEQNNMWLLGDYGKEFFFSYSTWYLTHFCAHSWDVWVEHSKSNSVSLHQCIISEFRFGWTNSREDVIEEE